MEHSVPDSCTELVNFVARNMARDADPARKYRAGEALRSWRNRTPGEQTERALRMLRAAAADYGHPS